MSVARRGFAWIELGLYLAWEILLSSLQVAWEVVTPHTTARPGIIRVPIVLERTDQITLLAHAITVTPGTVLLDINRPEGVVYVHVMFLDDREAMITRLKDEVESRVLRVLP